MRENDVIRSVSKQKVRGVDHTRDRGQNEVEENFGVDVKRLRVGYKQRIGTLARWKSDRRRSLDTRES